MQVMAPLCDYWKQRSQVYFRFLWKGSSAPWARITTGVRINCTYSQRIIFEVHFGLLLLYRDYLRGFSQVHFMMLCTKTRWFDMWSKCSACLWSAVVTKPRGFAQHSSSEVINGHACGEHVVHMTYLCDNMLQSLWYRMLAYWWLM